MNPNALIRIIAGLLWLASEAPAQVQESPAAAATVTLPVWPKGQMPGRSAVGPEKELPARGDNVIRLTDINEPTITIFQATAAKQPTPAVIICPGGAYSILAYNKEGTEIAAWLNSIGITGIVLKYRVPGNQDGAFQDLQRSLRLARHRAADWNIAPTNIGVMGFSAGGHLCARLSTNADKATYSKLDVPLADRDGNWVQKFQNTEDGSLFVGSQFFRYQEVEQFIEENFASGSPLPPKGGES